MQKTNQLTVPDWISIGIYTLIYFITVSVSAFVCVFLIPGYSYVYIPVVSALLSGPVFMLLHAKVPKFGAILTMATFIGGFFLISGRWPLSIIPAVLFGLIADLVNKPFKYQNDKIALVSYIIFSFAPSGPIWPLFLMPERYVLDLMNQGKTSDYIQTVLTDISLYTGYVMFALTLIAAIIGGLFGQYLIRKHIHKAGVL